jgi:biotin operon repressor
MVNLDKFMAVVIKAASKGENQAWVARRLGVSQPAVSIRLKGLRKRGIPVPRIAFGGGMEWKGITPAERLAAAYK